MISRFIVNLRRTQIPSSEPHLFLVSGGVGGLTASLVFGTGSMGQPLDHEWCDAENTDCGSGQHKGAAEATSLGPAGSSSTTKHDGRTSCDGPMTTRYAIHRPTPQPIITTPSVFCRKLERTRHRKVLRLMTGATLMSRVRMESAALRRSLTDSNLRLDSSVRYFYYDIVQHFR